MSLGHPDQTGPETHPASYLMATEDSCTHGEAMWD
jgi:hypothetical protein